MSYEDELDKALGELRAKLLAKHHDYGTGNLLKDGEVGIMIRCSDKVERLRHILKGEAKVKDETREDTWLDLAGYGLQAVLMGRGVLEKEGDGDPRFASLRSGLCPKCGNGLLFQSRHDLENWGLEHRSLTCKTCNVTVEYIPERFPTLESMREHVYGLLMEALFPSVKWSLS